MQPKEVKQPKRQLTMTRLSQCTGFPVQTLEDFVQRGLLPRAKEENETEPTFDGLLLLRNIGDVEDAE